jgi:hypothetical protein
MALHHFIAAHRDEIITRCKAKVAARSQPSAGGRTERARGAPVPRSGGRGPAPGRALEPGDRAERRQARPRAPPEGVHGLAGRPRLRRRLPVHHRAGRGEGEPISAADFCTLNRCLDEAIAGAVTEYRRGGISPPWTHGHPGAEHLGFVTHELRNLVNTAILSFEVLETGNVGVGGSTGRVLHRSLIGLKTLIGRSLAELRLTQGLRSQDQILLAGFIEEVSAAGILEADAKGIALEVEPIESGIAVEGDRAVLAAALGNLLQNAFKFTRPDTVVVVRVRATAERVLIEVQDECGGLPDRRRRACSSPSSDEVRTARAWAWASPSAAGGRGGWGPPLRPEPCRAGMHLHARPAATRESRRRGVTGGCRPRRRSPPRPARHVTAWRPASRAQSPSRANARVSPCSISCTCPRTPIRTRLDHPRSNDTTSACSDTSTDSQCPR